MSTSINPNAIVLLLKFVQNNSSYIEDFENGNLYFSSLQYFIDLELSEKNSKTGDKNEGNIHQVFKHLKYFHISDFYIPVKDINSLIGDYSLPDYQKKYLGICSFFAIQFKDLVKKDGSLNEYKIKEGVLKDLYRTKDGNRILFGVNNVARLQKECRKNRLGYGLVKYYDPSNIKDLTDLQEHKEFCKLNKYRFQHEFRIEKNLKDGRNLKHLDSIKDESFRWNILENYGNKSNSN